MQSDEQECEVVKENFLDAGGHCHQPLYIIYKKLAAARGQQPMTHKASVRL